MAKRPLLHGNPYDAYRAADGCWRPPRPEGLARVLAKAGYGARPRAEALVRSGRVSVDGTVVVEPGLAITPASEVLLDQDPLREAPRRYLALHKPAGYECHTRGGLARNLERVLPDNAVGLEPAGRMDVRGDGLLLVSNDLIWNRVVAESERLERRYEILVTGQINSMALDVVQAGISLTNMGTFKPDRVELLQQQGGEARLLVCIRGDHARKVKLAFASLLFEVLAMTRVGVGPVSLAPLGVGCCRDLTLDERHQLESLLGKGWRT